jgi:hypothetical protein
MERNPPKREQLAKESDCSGVTEPDCEPFKKVDGTSVPMLRSAEYVRAERLYDDDDDKRCASVQGVSRHL